MKQQSRDQVRKRPQSPPDRPPVQPELDERLRLQSEAGNRAASRVLEAAAGSPVQAKLTVGAADDPLEREADDHADRALRRLAAGAGSHRVQRSSAQGADPLGGTQVDGDTERAVRGAAGGSPLPHRTLNRMNDAFGADFSSVRVHTGGRADELNRSLQARAFTAGTNLFFREREFRPSTPSGERVLAHELSHVLQQSSGTARRMPIRVQRLTGVGEARGGNTEFHVEQIPFAWLDLANTIVSQQQVASLTSGPKDLTNVSLSGIGNNSAQYAGSAANDLMGVKDMIGGGMDMGTGIKAVQSQNSISKNFGAQKIESGATSLVGGGLGITGDSLGEFNSAQSSNASAIGMGHGSNLIPIGGEIADFYQAGIKGKKAIEDSVAAEKLRHERKRLKHDQDHHLPDDVRLQRFGVFYAEYDKYDKAKTAQTTFKNQADAKKLEITAAEADLKLKIADRDGKAKEAATAEAELERATKALAALEERHLAQSGDQTARQDKATAKQQKAQAKLQLKHDEALAAWNTSNDPNKGPKPTLANANPVVASKPGFFKKLVLGDKVTQQMLTGATTAKTDALAAKSAKLGLAQGAEGPVTTARNTLATRKNELTQLQTRAADEGKKMDAAKGTMKSGDLDRFEKALTAAGSPDVSASAGQLQFLNYCRDQRIKEFGKGTDLRKQYAKDVKAGTKTGSSTYTDLGHLDQFTGFARTRKAQSATYNSVEAAGHALDAAGTFTAGGDMGATKMTGKALKGASATAKGITSIVKRARRVHRTRLAKNEVKYGGKDDRGIGWGVKQFFGGNIDKSQKKVKDAIKTNKQNVVGQKEVKDATTGAVTTPAVQGVKGIGVDASAMSAETKTRLLTMLTIKAKREITRFLKCLVSSDDAVRKRAYSILHIVAETNLSGALAKIKDSDLDGFKTVADKVAAGTATPADEKEYKTLRGHLKATLEKHLDAPGG